MFTPSRALFLAVALLTAAPVAAAAPARQPYISLTRQFARFADQTKAMPRAERVALFRKRFNALFPGFYEPREMLDAAHYDDYVAKALEGFPQLRPAYERVERQFPVAYAKGIKHFQTFFPGFTQNLPAYFLHSLGEMDGGTRVVRGKTYFIFGADVIASIQDATTLGPFLDHELFHVENGKYFKDCDAVWCSLWTEGMATYAASVTNPGATDHQLFLDTPAPIRPTVDADWKKALCFTYAKRNSLDPAEYRIFFLGGAAERAFPVRFGYYIGFRMAQRLGAHHHLAELAHMKQAQARALVETELAAMVKEAGGCA
jgi:hypothetical protein